MKKLSISSAKLKFNVSNNLISFKATNQIISNKHFTFFKTIRGLINREKVSVSSYDKPPAMIDTNLTMYSSMREFSAYITKNAFDMSVMNERNVSPQTNYGTIDNPNLIFGADTTWRMVACLGPGSEEESSSHEKMYFIVREGPIHRCSFCGQCYKLVRLKDDLTDPDNTYYSSVFTQISDQLVSNFEYINSLTYPFSSSDQQVSVSNPFLPKNRKYIFVDNDHADMIMVDPAYRMKYYQEQEKKGIKQALVSEEIERQYKLSGLDNEKIVIAKDVYETWYKIEKDILKFDRIYNRYEKFEGRKMFDPANHDRREKRMLQRKKERLEESYTIYLIDLTEEEQMFRDYYESDLEEYRDDFQSNIINDESMLASYHDIDLNNFSFIEGSVDLNDYAPVEDHIENLLFKYRYKTVSDKHYNRRINRVLKKFCERAKSRDGSIIKNIGDNLEEIYVKKGYFENVSDIEDKLVPHANYIADEGLQQFKDYYESDIEEGVINKDILNDLNTKDKLRFTECYDNNLTKRFLLDKHYIRIPKREYDNNKSVVHNFIEDLIYFNYKAKIISRNFSFKDVASNYQSIPMSEEEVTIYDKDKNFNYIIDFKKSGKTSADHILTYKL